MSIWENKKDDRHLTIAQSSRDDGHLKGMAFEPRSAINLTLPSPNRRGFLSHALDNLDLFLRQPVLCKKKARGVTVYTVTLKTTCFLYSGVNEKMYDVMPARL